ncbi:MAG: UDP-N-acetylmuramate--L-alanine ligase [Leptospirales bacterium]|nr:UDP-N-acetylmuramate--L-alanine ligase [Leptospirales bacterium]
MFRNTKKMHFVGIGGIGMSGIAEILINMGYDVSGSDLHDSEQTRRLALLGAKIFIGHYPSNIQDYSVVITSSAINSNNPEIIEATKRSIPIIHRSEMLAELVRLKQGIGVAGTHGKTTTSSMLAYVLYHGGLNPTAVIGGKVLNFGSNARTGSGAYIVFEADESDGTFLKLHPTIAIVTNIDADHLDHYKYFNNLKEAFLDYLNRVPFYGYSVVCIEDVTVRELLPSVKRSFVTYGFSDDAVFRAVDVRFEDRRMKYKCLYKGSDLGEFSIMSPGKHNVLNSLSVIAVALELGLSPDKIRESLAEFKGVARRLEHVGEAGGILVVDDYGHHPTEIRATLAALKHFERRLLVVFQPHRYTRTELLIDEFGKAFGHADKLFLTHIYPAGEQPIEGVSSEVMLNSVIKNNGKSAELVEKFEHIPELVALAAKQGDIVVTLGAGDIYKAAPLILDELRKRL